MPKLYALLLGLKGPSNVTGTTFHLGLEISRHSLFFLSSPQDQNSNQKEEEVEEEEKDKVEIDIGRCQRRGSHFVLNVWRSSEKRRGENGRQPTVAVDSRPDRRAQKPWEVSSASFFFISFRFLYFHFLLLAGFACRVLVWNLFLRGLRPRHIGRKRFPPTWSTHSTTLTSSDLFPRLLVSSFLSFWTWPPSLSTKKRNEMKSRTPLTQSGVDDGSKNVDRHSIHGRPSEQINKSERKEMKNRNKPAHNPFKLWRTETARDGQSLLVTPTKRDWRLESVDCWSKKTGWQMFVRL